MIRLRHILVALLALMVPAGAAAAHETTRSYVTLTRAGGETTLRVRIAFRDIEVAVWMDQDLDGRITWGEARGRLDAVTDYVASGLSLDAGGACSLGRTGATVSRNAAIDYLDLTLAADCPSADAPLTLRSRLFLDIDRDHRMFLTAHVAGATTTTILGNDRPQVRLDAGSGGALAAFASYFRAGVEHLMAGADHLVFLLTLILPAVTLRRYTPSRAALSVLSAVTGFTLAHALSLTAATAQILRPPPDLINALIALTIVLAAIDNLVAFLPGPRAAAAAFFGIIHGFGFASALGVLDLGGAGLATALFGFNLGIEAAQIAFVTVTLPALYVLRGGRPMLWTGSLLAAGIGTAWLYLRLMPML